MDLPQDFLTKMKALLQDEYEDFLFSYEKDRSLGLRVNPLKISKEEFIKIAPFSLQKIPWVDDGFFYQEADHPGKHPYHEAGLYYIQEPSAMAVAEIMDPKPGEKILDLAAAPGGKTTHIAGKMKQEGLLLANEIHPTRAKILSQNIERMGIKNAVVTNETPEHLAAKLPAFFDRILVDAPCSGEGMFRKDIEARSQWSIDNVKQCVIRQKDILEHAHIMLKPGGQLVYSTCTFAPEENEGTISQFVKEHPCYEIESTNRYEHFGQGRKEWVQEGVEKLDETIRIWPHQTTGEGHYIAVLRKKDGQPSPKLKRVATIKDKKLLREYEQFTKENLLTPPKGNFLLFGNQLYIVPSEMISLKQLKVIRPGWHLGTNKKNRFEPSHALALSLTTEEVKQTLSLDVTSREIIAYLKGEALKVMENKGWYLVTVNGFSIGWGKLSNELLKNHYPKGLRWM